MNIELEELKKIKQVSDIKFYLCTHCSRIYIDDVLQQCDVCGNIICEKCKYWCECYMGGNPLKMYGVKGKKEYNVDNVIHWYENES